MAQELVTTETTSTPIACETRSSATLLASLIPAWLQRDLVEASAYHLPAKLPDGAVMDLRKVADTLSRSLAVPASEDERKAILGELRLKTAVRNESVDEARARFRLLRAELSDVPADVLREASSAYANANKFFPSGPAEIRPYIEQIRFDRSKAAHQLRRLAREAEEQELERTRLEKDPLTPEAAAAIIDEFNLRPESVERIRPTGPRRKPTVEDYIAMGVDRAAAERCLAERAPASQ